MGRPLPEMGRIEDCSRQLRGLLNGPILTAQSKSVRRNRAEKIVLSMRGMHVLAGMRFSASIS